MASSGKEKYNKYFKNKEVKTFAKSKKGFIPVYESFKGTKKIDDLKDNTEITVLGNGEFQGRYFIKYGNNKFGYLSDVNVSKPLKTRSKVGSDLLRILASDFTKKGKNCIFKFGEKDVECKEFTSKQQLVNSILYGLETTKGVSEEVRKTFERWLKTPNFGNIEWEEGVTDDEINKFGVYLGEILIGLISLAGKEKQHLSPSPWNKKTKRFLIPTDSAFSGVDSFLELEDGEIIPISNKFGVGAAASFFGNLLIKGLENYKSLPNCVFKDIVESALDINVTKEHLSRKQKSKEIVYEYGIRKILEIEKSEIPNTYEVFNAIKYSKEHEGKNIVVSKIFGYKNVDNKILNMLEKSVTAFFSREIAKRLENDQKSLDVIKTILVGKNFWQANLDESSWKKGKILYKMRKSGETSIKIIGSKSAIGDLDAKQGTVNYILR